MKKYESAIKRIDRNREEVFSTLSDLLIIEKYKDKIPDGKVKELSFTEDSISFEAPMVGQVKIVVIERKAPETIKFGVEKLPIDMNMWLQFIEKPVGTTFLKVTLHVEIPMMLRPMIGNKLDGICDKVAEMIALALNAKGGDQA